MILRRVTALALLLLLTLGVSVGSEAGTYYVAPHGNDANPGTLEAPWATLQKASAEATAGDTIVLLPGTYEGVLNPINSGTPDEPITFRAAERRTAKLIGRPGGGYTIALHGVSHIHLEGLHLDSAATGSGWVHINNSSYITLKDSLLENSPTSPRPFLINGSEQIFILDNDIRRWADSWSHTEQVAIDMIRIYGSRHVLVEGNSISHALHTAFAVGPQSDGPNTYLVVRGNVFHNGWSRNYELFGTDTVLFEDNLVTNGFAGSRSADTYNKYSTQRGIYRFNKVYANWGGAERFTVGWVESETSEMRVYNNVFVDNAQFGLSALLEPRLGRRVFLNNAIVNNDPVGSHTQVVYSGNDAALLFTHNLIWSAGKDAVSSLNVQIFEQTLSADPRFADPSVGNFLTRNDSPLRDSGRVFTHTVGSGSGDVLPVADAAYFFDGFGIEGELGDLIVVGSTEQSARVVEVDYERNTLKLDRSVSWNDGDPVGLPWSGAAPDIGVLEQGGGRASVHVLASDAVVPVGASIEFTLYLQGIEPASITWHMGDGTVYTGAAVRHVYAEKGDYGIRVQVIDRSGARYRGTSFVVVQDPLPNRLDQPLLSFDFDAGDTEWWKYWKAYRPFPAKWSRAYTSTWDGYLKIEAPSPEAGTLPAWIYPAGWNLNGPIWWNIEKYPYVRFRYRIEPGTPVALYVQGFDGLNGRKVILARAPMHSDRTVTAAAGHLLLDDGEWHEATVDVRVVREVFPELDVLQGIGFQTAETNPVATGGYGISEFHILPASHRVVIPELRIAQPAHSEEVSGAIEVRYSFVGVADDDPVQSVQASIGASSVSTDPTGVALLDTLQVNDGLQPVSIVATTESGYRFGSSIMVNVKNRWSSVIDMLPPWEFFGQVIDRLGTSAQSEGWRYVGSEPQAFFGDTSRVVRSTSNTEFLEWETPHLTEMVVTVYTKMPVAELAGFLQLTGSAGEKGWTTLRRMFTEMGVSGAGWRQVVVRATPAGSEPVEKVRLTLLGDGIAPDAIQIGKVELYGLR